MDAELKLSSVRIHVSQFDLLSVSCMVMTSNRLPLLQLSLTFRNRFKGRKLEDFNNRMSRDARFSLLVRVGNTLSRIRNACTIPPFVRFFRDDVYTNKIADIGSLTLDDIIGNLFGRH